MDLNWWQSTQKPVSPKQHKSFLHVVFFPKSREVSMAHGLDAARLKGRCLLRCWFFSFPPFSPTESPKELSHQTKDQKQNLKFPPFHWIDLQVAILKILPDLPKNGGGGVKSRCGLRGVSPACGNGARKDSTKSIEATFSVVCGHHLRDIPAASSGE